MISSKKAGALCLALLLMGGSLYLLGKTQFAILKEHAALMQTASQRTELAFNAIRVERLRRGYAIDPMLDPNHTGIIGSEYNETTTSIGNLGAKRSTTNPNVAAMVVDQFVQLGLQPGDRVAINLSGSFPALNMAVLVAADTMGLMPVTISSAGASTYGANLPGFTWLDMERHLADLGLVTPAAAVSIGGEGDMGLEFSEETRRYLWTRMDELGYNILVYPDFEENMAARLAIYGEVKAFVNVGGNLFAFGTHGGSAPTAYGILTEQIAHEYGNGLIYRYIADGVPVVHLLNARDMLPAWGLPYDPIPLPGAGEGGVYYQSRYHPAAKAVGAVAIILSVLLIWRVFRR